MPNVEVQDDQFVRRSCCVPCVGPEVQLTARGAERVRRSLPPLRPTCGDRWIWTCRPTWRYYDVYAGREARLLSFEVGVRLRHRIRDLSALRKRYSGDVP